MAAGGQVVENRVFVNGVPQTLGHSELATHFAQFGCTKDIYLPMLFGTNQHKGIAFVTFDNPQSQELALKYPSHVICGHQVSVSVCLAKGPNKTGHFPGSVPSPERLFVTGIPLEATQDEVQAYFKPYGTWSDFFMPRGHFAAGHKGMCFISFHSPASVQQVINSRPHTIRDQQVVCDIAAPREKGGGKGKDVAPFNNNSNQMQLANAAQTAQALQAAAIAVAQAGLPDGWPCAAGGFQGQLGAAAGGFVNWNDIGADQLQAQSQQALMFQQPSQLDLQSQQLQYSYQQLQQAQYLQQSAQQQLSQQQLSQQQLSQQLTPQQTQQLQMSVSQLQQQLQQPVQQSQQPLQQDNEQQPEPHHLQQTQHLQQPQYLQQQQLEAQPDQQSQPLQQFHQSETMPQTAQWQQSGSTAQSPLPQMEQTGGVDMQAMFASATQAPNSQSTETTSGVPEPGRACGKGMSGKHRVAPY